MPPRLQADALLNSEAPVEVRLMQILQIKYSKSHKEAIVDTQDPRDILFCLHRLLDDLIGPDGKCMPSIMLKMSAYHYCAAMVWRTELETA